MSLEAYITALAAHTPNGQEETGRDEISYDGTLRAYKHREQITLATEYQRPHILSLSTRIYLRQRREGGLSRTSINRHRPGPPESEGPAFGSPLTDAFNAEDAITSGFPDGALSEWSSVLVSVGGPK